MHYDVIIVGAGPGGLACAQKLCEHNVSTLVIERKSQIGPKACAGGVTWSGFLQNLPKELIEASFPVQHVHSTLQNIVVSRQQPLIATVNRFQLGQFMANSARSLGAVIRESCAVVNIENKSVYLRDLRSNTIEKISCDFLVGADGSSVLFVAIFSYL